MFPYSYRNTRGSLKEREIAVGTRVLAGRVFPRYFEFSQTFTSVSTLFRVLPNFHECFHAISSTPKLPRVFSRYFEFSQTFTSVSTLFRVLPNFHECFHAISSSPKLSRVFPRNFEYSQTFTSVSTLFRVLSNFHECFYNVWEHGKKVLSISFIK